MASSAKISDLPVELLIEVFKYLNSITEVVHLGRTSRLFHKIWTSFAHTIYATILPRSIPAYQQIQTLSTIIIQRHNYKAARFGKRRPYSQTSPHNKAMLALWLSRAAALQIKVYESDLEQRERTLAPLPGQPLSITSSDSIAAKVKLNVFQRSEFLESYYKLWLLTIIPKPYANARLAAMRVEQMMVLVEFGLRKIIYITPIACDALRKGEGYWDPLLGRLSRCFVFQIMKVGPLGKFCLV